MYAGVFIIRFKGTLTQGPNKGKTYTYASSWGGVRYETVEQARAVVQSYGEKEPLVQFKVFYRVWVEERGWFAELEMI
jgi:hypothetical protein